MNIVICGAGQVGSYAAEVMGADRHNITIIDTDAARLRSIEDSMDVSTLRGNCATAEMLRQAGAGEADLVIAATNNDEINLLTASVAKGIGALKCIARVHHRTFFEERGLDYQEHLGIDRLICPEYSTAQAIARALRNPGALAIEHFARGQIQMQELPVSKSAKAIGRPLSELRLPQGARLVGITRNHEVFLPEAGSVIETGDIIVLAGNSDAFQTARKLFGDPKTTRRRIALMGGPGMAVWLCRALRDRNFGIRLFEQSMERAEQLAEKLDWVTVINADPIDPAVFKEESLAQVDTFVALEDDDEHNILGSAWAKSMGVRQAIAVVQRPNYLHLLGAVGIDRAFSPRMVAVKEIENLMDTSPLRRLASLGDGVLDVYRVRIGEQSHVIDTPLRELTTLSDWIIVAVQHGEDVSVPGANDVIRAGDTALVVGQHGMEQELTAVFIGA
ncbi:MAG: Trk system potassium transporter TrkA [Phycisphaerales bacterium]|nr:Trk system potassium transporter TrkA [Phycisphaerales bacterium]